MIVCSTNVVTDKLNLIDLGAPETLGGKVLEGTPKISVRIDYKKMVSLPAMSVLHQTRNRYNNLS